MAVIEYSDKSIPKLFTKATIKTDLKQHCILKNKILRAVYNEVPLRAIPSLRGKIKTIVYKNYLIAYEYKIDNSWYKICDGQYVHKSEVVEISSTKAKGLLNAKK